MAVSRLQSGSGPSCFPRPYMVVLLLALLPGILWWIQTGNPLVYVFYQTPPGQWAYVLAKLLGLYAIVLLWCQMMYGLLGSLAPGWFLSWSVPRHRALGLLTLAVIILHFAAFFVASSLREGAIAYALFLPHFEGGYYPLGLSLGWLSLAALLIVVPAGMALARHGGWWRGMHWLSAVSFIAAFAHAFRVGSETRLGIVRYFYLGLGATVIAALFLRVVQLIRYWKRSRTIA